MIILTWVLSFCLVQFQHIEAFYQCGVRKVSFGTRVHLGWASEASQWPWHVGLFHKYRGDIIKYACGATLLNKRHVLTSAHCVTNRKTRNPLAANKLKLHFGQHTLSKIDQYAQIRNVSDVHVHPEYATHLNDIAILVTSNPVQYTDFVIPICMEQLVEKDLRNMVGQRGWITGWGTTESGATSNELRTASMPVVDYLACITDDLALFRNLLNRNVFCAGERNGTGPGTGDSGGGMYFVERGRWTLRGIISFAKQNGMRNEADTSKFFVFVLVQQFSEWITEIMGGDITRRLEYTKRKSEIECDRFQRWMKKRVTGSCANARCPHVVSLLYPDGVAKCAGVLVDEQHVLTACHCEHFNSNTLVQRPNKVQIDSYGAVNISEITCHPEYKAVHLYHDLAIVKLSRPVELSRNLIPACLASNWTENLHDRLLQTGYVKNLFTGLKKFIESNENRIVNKMECDLLSIKSKVAPSGTIPEQLCVINYDRLRLNSLALPGTPLQSVNRGNCLYMVLGVLSSGNFGPNLTAVDVYTRISYYIDWIEQVVWNQKSPKERVQN